MHMKCCRATVAGKCRLWGPAAGRKQWNKCKRVHIRFVCLRIQRKIDCEFIDIHFTYSIASIRIGKMQHSSHNPTIGCHYLGAVCHSRFPSLFYTSLLYNSMKNIGSACIWSSSFAKWTTIGGTHRLRCGLCPPPPLTISISLDWMSQCRMRLDTI